MKLLESAKSKMIKNKNGENVLHLEITEVVLIHCKIVNNEYQQDSRSYIYLSLINIWSITRHFTKNFIFLKTCNSEFSDNEVWFTDQNSKPLEIENKINITLVINQNVKYRR